MRNLKHTIVAIIAVSLVGSLAAHQAINFSAATATKLTQPADTIFSAPAVLPGDGEGETEADIQLKKELENKPNTASETATGTEAAEIVFPAPLFPSAENSGATAGIVGLSAELSLEGKEAYILTEDGGSINLRAEANTESTILDVLDVGTKFTILGNEQEWFHIETDGYKGYVKAEFVTFDYEKVKKVLLSHVMYQNGTINVSSNVHGTPDENSIILDLVGVGAKVTILETTENGWHKIYFGDNYDIGYVAGDKITIGDMVNRAEVDAKRHVRIQSVAKKAKITTNDSVVAVKLLPSKDSETLTTLANNTTCKIISGGSNWTKIIVSATNEIGYVKTANVQKIAEPKPATAKAKKSTNVSTNSAKASAAKAGKAVETNKDIAVASGNGSRLVAQASQYIGTRYVYGGTSPSGFDCSGLVQYSLKKLGVSIARSSGAQYGYGTSVSRANLQPGDLVFFSRGGGISHVAIYAGNGQVIHAPRPGKSVCYQSLSGLTGSLKYVGAKRVI